MPAWIVFELVPTKLPHYPLPVYPALCLIGARWAVDWHAGRRGVPRWLERVGYGLALDAVLLLALAAIGVPELLDASLWLGVPGAAAAVLAAWLLWRRGVAAALVAMPLLYGAVLGLELPHLEAIWISQRAAEAAVGSGVLGSIGYAEPSLRFLAGTDTKFLSGGAVEAGALALASGEVSRLLVDEKDLAAFHAEAAHLGLDVRDIVMIRGYNYSRGRWTTLTLFTR